MKKIPTPVLFCCQGCDKKSSVLFLVLLYLEKNLIMITMISVHNGK